MTEEQKVAALDQIRRGIDGARAEGARILPGIITVAFDDGTAGAVVVPRDDGDDEA